MPSTNKTNKKTSRATSENYEDYLIERLKNPAHAEGYLEAALEAFQEDGHTEALLLALRNLAKAQGGMTALSQKTHLNRQALYKALSPTGNPGLKILGTVIKALGFQLSAHRV